MNSAQIIDVFKGVYFPLQLQQAWHRSHGTPYTNSKAKELRDSFKEAVRATIKIFKSNEDLIHALTELTDTIRAYELHGEVDAGCDNKGPYQEAVKLIRKIEKQRIKGEKS